MWQRFGRFLIFFSHLESQRFCLGSVDILTLAIGFVHLRKMTLVTKYMYLPVF